MNETLTTQLIEVGSNRESMRDLFPSLLSAMAVMWQMEVEPDRDSLASLAEDLAQVGEWLANPTAEAPVLGGDKHWLDRAADLARVVQALGLMLHQLGERESYAVTFLAAQAVSALEGNRLELPEFREGDLPHVAHELDRPAVARPAAG